MKNYLVIFFNLVLSRSIVFACPQGASEWDVLKEMFWQKQYSDIGSVISSDINWEKQSLNRLLSKIEECKLSEPDYLKPCLNFRLDSYEAISFEDYYNAPSVNSVIKTENFPKSLQNYSQLAELDYIENPKKFSQVQEELIQKMKKDGLSSITFGNDNKNRLMIKFKQKINGVECDRTVTMSLFPLRLKNGDGSISNIFDVDGKKNIESLIICNEEAKGNSDQADKGKPVYFSVYDVPREDLGIGTQLARPNRSNLKNDQMNCITCHIQGGIPPRDFSHDSGDKNHSKFLEIQKIQNFYQREDMTAVYYPGVSFGSNSFSVIGAKDIGFVKSMRDQVLKKCIPPVVAKKYSDEKDFEDYQKKIRNALNCTQCHKGGRVKVIPFNTDMDVISRKIITGHPNLWEETPSPSFYTNLSACVIKERELFGGKEFGEVDPDSPNRQEKMSNLSCEQLESVYQDSLKGINATSNEACPPSIPLAIESIQLFKEGQLIYGDEKKALYKLTNKKIEGHSSWNDIVICNKDQKEPKFQRVIQTAPSCDTGSCKQFTQIANFNNKGEFTGFSKNSPSKDLMIADVTGMNHEPLKDFNHFTKWYEKEGRPYGMLANQKVEGTIIDGLTGATLPYAGTLPGFAESYKVLGSSIQQAESYIQTSFETDSNCVAKD
ncbi:hypothetical protein N9N67_03975 [Bacteriovoracaceae bacterium]|nr:hypothetical protein [Bacteriovoracaceae bacterium]